MSCLAIRAAMRHHRRPQATVTTSCYRSLGRPSRRCFEPSPPPPEPSSSPLGCGLSRDRRHLRCAVDAAVGAVRLVPSLPSRHCCCMLAIAGPPSTPLLDAVTPRSPRRSNCKKYGRAMRIGTNHGSLTDRIMSYHGDSPTGMVKSAFEFARICQKLDFHNFVFSMKASNPVVMVQAYRLLVAETNVQGRDYPLHLGVTEAGEGEDGRIKSAIGIGTLLQDGLGDTIRVSLTEPPEEEIDPCRRLANLGMRATELQKGVAPFEEKHKHYFDF